MSSLDQSTILADSDALGLQADGSESLNHLQKQQQRKLTSADAIVTNYLCKVEPIFHALHNLREKAWRNPKADEHFRALQKRADSADSSDGANFFYEMNKAIGNQLHAATDAFTVTDSGTAGIRALNLCMAPGGYTWSLLQTNPTASISGITLPREIGGHPMLVPFGDDDPRIEVKFMDITMLATEYGTSTPDIPLTHPEASKFSDERPYKDLSFDIVLCDGQVLRRHTRAECRENQEGFRLLMSQLIFGLKRIRPGGTFIILLHKVDAWISIKLLSSFDLFSRIQLFKPKKIHGPRSSFYLVAKDVQPSHGEAINSIEKWKLGWWKATFGGDGYSGEVQEDEESDVRFILDSFGPKLVALGRGIWNIQLKALTKASYNK